MNALQAAFLGLLQGLSEFLPVSSSGHLVLGAALLGLPAPGLSFSILVHLGTALATVVMLRSEIAHLAGGLLGRDPARRAEALRVAGLLAAASVPAALVGIFAGDLVDRAFSSPVVASVGLLVTGLVLRLTRTARAPRRPGDRDVLATLTTGRGLAVGLAQAVAVVPGVSRSGMTISAGLAVGMSREDAARFSFLLALPAVLGAALLDYRDAVRAGAPMVSAGGLVGAAVAFVSGMLALGIVFRVVRRGELSKFAYYCYLVGGASLVLLLTRR